MYYNRIHNAIQQQFKASVSDALHVAYVLRNEGIRQLRTVKPSNYLDSENVYFGNLTSDLSSIRLKDSKLPSL